MTLQERLVELQDMTIGIQISGLGSHAQNSFQTAQALKADLMEIVGADESLTGTFRGGYVENTILIRNLLRAELREAIEKYTK